MNEKINKPDIIVHLENVAPFIPYPLYWVDANTLIVMGANKSCLEAMGAAQPEDVIGKTPYDYYPKDIARNIVEHIKKVGESKMALSQEDVIKDITTGKTRYFTAIRAPLFDSTNNMIGVIGTSIEITAQKEAEQLRIECEKQKLQIEANKEFIECLEEIQHVITSHKTRSLNKKVNHYATIRKNLSLQPTQPKELGKIILTKREREIIYFLSLNKSPKEIANILSTIENKKLSPLTISAIIDKQLYIKFNVNGVGKLLEAANKLKLIPFTLS